MAAQDRFYCIDNLHVLSVSWSSYTRCKMNILIKWDFFTTKKDGSTGPTTLGSDGSYYEIMGP